MASRGRITIEIDKTTKSQLQAVLKDKLSKISSYTDDVLPVQQRLHRFFSFVKTNQIQSGIYWSTHHLHGARTCMVSQRVMIAGVRAGDGG
jgi:hypothetical protein